MEIVIFDLEGVLIDNTRRLNYALTKLGVRGIQEIPPHKRRIFWNIFLNKNLSERFDRINPVGLRYLADRSKKYFIAIVSGAPKQIVLGHIKKIREVAKKENLEIRMDRIYYREKSRVKAADFKRRIFLELAYEGRIVEVHDDDPNVLEVAKKLGVKCYLWINLKPTEYC